MSLPFWWRLPAVTNSKRHGAAILLEQIPGASTSNQATTRRCGSLRSSCSSPSLSLAPGLVVAITTGGVFNGCTAPATSAAMLGDTIPHTWMQRRQAA